MNNAVAALELTQRLIRFKTVNPPGEERACTQHVGHLLEDVGFTISYHEFAERRTSLVVITSYSIHYTKLYDTRLHPSAEWLRLLSPATP